MARFAALSPTVSAYLFQLPLYAVWVTGVVLCMKRRQRHPKVYSVGMVAFSLLFFESLVGTLFMYSLLPKILSGSQMSLQEVYFLVGVVRAIIHAGLWVLVLVAFFGWRNTPRSGKVERAADVGD